MVINTATDPKTDVDVENVLAVNVMSLQYPRTPLGSSRGVRAHSGS